MLTLKEARKLQKERESNAVLWFVFSLALVGIATYVLLEFTNVFEISTVFYLIPVALIAIAVKKTEIYKLLTAREFVGKVIYLNVYVVKSQRVRGERSYMTNEALEVEMIIENDEGKSKSLQIPSSPATYNIAEGTELALLRFIDTPIILEKK